MTFYQLLLVLHLLAAMVWVGGGLAGMVVGGSIYRSGDMSALSRFCRSFASVAAPLFGGSALLVLATGIWMVARSSVDFGAMWISIGFTGWLVSMGMGATIVGRSWFKLGLALEEPGANAETARQPFFYARLWTIVDLAVRVGVVAVMVTRPT
jgi:uncharacterized membrane protein